MICCLTPRWSQRRPRLPFIASGFWLADVTGGVAQLWIVRHPTHMDDNDTLRQILGFFAMMIGTLVDPIALPIYIAIGIFVRNLAGALAASIGFAVVFRLVIAAIRSNAEAGGETGSPDFEIIAASVAGAAFATGIAYLCASRYRKSVKDEKKPDA